MANVWPRYARGRRGLRGWLHAAYFCDLVPQPDLDLRAECLNSFALRLGGSRFRTAHEEHSKDGAASAVQLLPHSEALKRFEEVVASVLEVLGEGRPMAVGIARLQG
jgi:hypothetical protein